MAKNFIIPLVIYPFDIMFSVGETDAALKAAIEGRLIAKDAKVFFDSALFDTSDTRRGYTIHNNDGGQTIIRLPRKPTTPENYGTVSHEIFHAVDIIFRKVGIKLSHKSDEAYAYLIGYITEQFYKNV